MNTSLTIPFWFAIIAGVFGAYSLLVLVILPSFRRFLNWRSERVLEDLDTRLDLKLAPFKLSNRRALVDRLEHDEKIQDVVESYSKSSGESKKEVEKKVRRYAQEIVPAFNAFIYFRFGAWIGKRLSRALYRVRLGFSDDEAFSHIKPKSSVVFIMNHRSNMDYVLLGYLARDKTALSFAVGEWARIFPLKQLIQSMGAFFVRRGSGNELYRRVLERYVQISTKGGVVQAVFPEGGLSRDGRMRPPKVGLLDYMLRTYEPNSDRDLVFVPVAVNYDRVIEDRNLVLDSNLSEKEKEFLTPRSSSSEYLLTTIWRMLRGKWYRYGYAVVNFGRPISIKDYENSKQVDFSAMDRSERFAQTMSLANYVLNEIAQITPVVPVSLVASIFCAATNNLDRSWSSLEIKSECFDLIKRLENNGAFLYIPRESRDYAIEVGLRMLTMRRLLLKERGEFRINMNDLPILQYYANTIVHLLDRKTVEGSRLSSTDSVA